MILRKGFRNNYTNGQTIEEASIDPAYDTAVFHHYWYQIEGGIHPKEVEGKSRLSAKPDRDCKISEGGNQRGS